MAIFRPLHRQRITSRNLRSVVGTGLRQWHLQPIQNVCSRAPAGHEIPPWRVLRDVVHLPATGASRIADGDGRGGICDRSRGYILSSRRLRA